MDWAVAIEGRTDPGGIVLLCDDRSEAESIASEIRTMGTKVTVRQYNRSTSAHPAGRGSTA